VGDPFLTDDDSDLASLLKTTLEALGHDVSVTQATSEVDDLVRSSECDLLVIDLRAAADRPIIMVKSRSDAEVRVGGVGVLRFEGLEIDVIAKQVRIRGTLLHFTPTELQMLILLARSDNRLVTHGDLYREVWPDGSAESGHYVRVYIQQIRQKLGDHACDPTFIATEISQGYRWLPTPLEEPPLILMPS
jgi:DNA-binding response OmpR family regulator